MGGSMDTWLAVGLSALLQADRLTMILGRTTSRVHRKQVDLSCKWPDLPGKVLHVLVLGDVAGAILAIVGLEAVCRSVGVELGSLEIQLPCQSKAEPFRAPLQNVQHVLGEATGTGTDVCKAEEAPL